MARRMLKRPTRLVLDYDGTLTVQDTMAVLGRLPRDGRKAWEEIVAAYVKDEQVYKDTPYPWKKHDRGEYSGWLAARRWVEQNSARRVEEAAFFRGATADDVSRAVTHALHTGELQLRDGWRELFEAFVPASRPDDGTSHPSSIEVLSVNWSATSIRQALWQSAGRGTPSPQQQQLRQYVNDMRIYANEIEGLCSPHGSSGRVVRPLDADIRTSGDKLRYLHATTGSADAKPFTVYAGDSATDFDALCAADLGIWLCDVPEAEYERASRATFAPLDFVPPPLHSIPDLHHTPALFYWAPSLRTVLDALAEPAP